MKVEISEFGEYREVENIIEIKVSPVFYGNGEFNYTHVALIHDKTLKHEPVFLRNSEDYVSIRQTEEN